MRYSTGLKISQIFSEIIEEISLTQYSHTKFKKFHLEKAIAKNDCLKFMLFTLHELGGIKTENFSVLVIKAEEVGKILYGWKCKIES